MKKHLWAICFSAALIAFTAYIALDTFVFRASYDTNAVEMNLSMFADISADAEDSSRQEGGSSESQVQAPAADPNPPGIGNFESAELPGDSDRAGTSDGSSDLSSDVMSGEMLRPGPSGENSADGSSGSSEPSDRERRPGGSGGPMDSAESAAGVDAAADYSGDTTYKDNNVTITLTEYNQYDTAIYVADVIVSSAQYIKTAFANDTYGKNVTQSTSAMAAAHGAILAVNGDYYGAQERGFVIRNGIVYRNTTAGKDVMCIYADGTMGIVSDQNQTAEQLVENGVWQAFSFGPALIRDGSVTVTEYDEVGLSKASNPRTAVGMIDKNHYIFVVSDGRTSESAGLSLYQLAQFMQSLGARIAYNLDGGGSSTMYFNGQVVNNPTTGGSIRERGVSDIVYIG